MEESAVDRPASPLRGLALFSLDMWLGAAVITAVSYLLFRWSADFFSLSAFWGYEPGQFGQFVNVVKTAASLSFILALIVVVTNGENGRLNHLFLYCYTSLRDQPEPPITKQEAWKIKILSGAIGGSLFIWLIVFLYLPLLADFNLFPNNLALNAEPFQIINNTVPEGIIIEPGEPIESTIEQNFFTIHMDSNEYFILVEPLEEDSGHYGLSSSFTEIAQEEFSISSSGSTQEDRFDWVVVTSRESDRIDFEVLHTGNGPPSSYRVHVYENITDNQNILNIFASEIENNQNNFTYQFQAERDKPYIFIAWPKSQSGTISISLDEENGRNYPAALAGKMDVALLKAESTGDYNLTIRDPHGQPLTGVKLLTLSPGSPSVESTNDAAESSLKNNIILAGIFCNSPIFVLAIPLIVIRIFLISDNLRNGKTKINAPN